MKIDIKNTYSILYYNASKIIRGKFRLSEFRKYLNEKHLNPTLHPLGIKHGHRARKPVYSHHKYAADNSRR